jgi:hypothetical protein
MSFTLVATPNPASYTAGGSVTITLTFSGVTSGHTVAVLYNTGFNPYVNGETPFPSPAVWNSWNPADGFSATVTFTFSCVPTGSQTISFQLQQDYAIVASCTCTVNVTAALPPSGISVSPNVGTNAGGTAVTISGSGFTNTTSVTFGGNAASSVVVVNDSTITAVTPSNANGAVNVVVSRSCDSTSGTGTNSFTFETIVNGSANLTGVNATFAANGPTGAGTASTALTGVNATFAANSPSGSGNATRALTNVNATFAAGNITAYGTTHVNFGSTPFDLGYGGGA